MNPYTPKRQVLHDQWKAALSAQNRADRIKRYPQTAHYGLSAEPVKEAVIVNIRRVGK